MKPVTPHLDRLSLAQRLRLGGEVLWTYARVRWAMRDADAQRAVSRLRAGAAAVAPPAEEHDEEDREVQAWRLARATRKVLVRLPSDSRCLFSSLTLLCMLERRGIPQRLVLAVRAQPFGAHAWVEVGGRPVLPEAEPGYERLLEL